MKKLSAVALLAALAGASVAVASDDLIQAVGPIQRLTPVSVNGIPYTGGMTTRGTTVLFSNLEPPFFTTGSAARQGMLDDSSFIAIPADSVSIGDPILGVDGPVLTNATVNTCEFSLFLTGFTAPTAVEVFVFFHDIDVLASLDDPYFLAADPVLGGFRVRFDAPAPQAGNTIFTSGPVDLTAFGAQFNIPNTVWAVSTFYRTGTDINDPNPWNTIATAWAFGLAAGNANTVGGEGPTVGGSASFYVRDTDNNGLFTQGGAGPNENRVFANPNYANTFLALTGTGETACPSADFNADGFVDFFDYDDYVACFEGAGAPGCNSDFNGDGFVDFFDYDAFVFAFEGCP
jgi:hypothetical protein